MPVIDKGEYKVVIDDQVITIRTRKIDSSNVEWIGWPRSGEPLMVVQYKGGGRYAYMPVSRQQAVAAAYHGSTGGYLNRAIKSSKKVMKLR